MAKSSSKRSSEWSRCAEGFSDVKLSSNINKIRKSSLKRKSSETAVFNHGNIFEKLFGGTDNEKSSSEYILQALSYLDPNLYLLHFPIGIASYESKNKTCKIFRLKTIS